MVIQFNTKGHDGFIDFIKAYAIICVLIGHTLPCLDEIGYGIWAGMQVPLFILVQSFHCYKKDKAKIQIGKVFRRVMIPFLICEIITFVLALLFTDKSHITLIRGSLSGGGYGPGSYFPWLYLQAAVLLPLFAIILNRCNKVTSLIIFLIICEGFEILFSIINVPNWIYRILAVRYIFLFYLGWIWAKEGIRINWVSVLFTFLSLGALIYFEYYSVNDEPLFYNTSWKYHRWPCYFYVAYGLTGILYVIWSKLKNNTFTTKITKIIKRLSSSSYEIFLVQMSACFLLEPKSFGFIAHSTIEYVIWAVLIWAISLSGGFLINRMKGEIIPHKQ